MANNNDVRVPRQFIVVGVILAILVVVLLFLILNQEKPAAPEPNVETVSGNNISEADDDGTFVPGRDFIETVDNLDGATSDVSGANLITDDNKVVNEQGQVVQNNAVPMTAEAPRLSQPINPESAPADAIKITADAKGFIPNQFTVNAGQPVTLVLTASGAGSRLVFNDQSLLALEMPVPADYTMAKTFNAPSVPGEYTFFQDMPGRTQQTGKMIVK